MTRWSEIRNSDNNTEAPLWLHCDHCGMTLGFAWGCWSDYRDDALRKQAGHTEHCTAVVPASVREEHLELRWERVCRRLAAKHRSAL